MKKFILHFLMLFVLLSSTEAKAQEFCDTNFYAKFLTGLNFLEDTTADGNRATYQIGYEVGGSLGYAWRYGLRLEAEYAFKRNNINNIHFVLEGSSHHGHFQTSSYMANLFWDLPLSSWRCAFWNIQPFFGAGLGHDFQQMHASNSRILFNQKWHRFAWQLMAGVAYQIFCNTEISLEYKFHQGGTHFYSHFLGMGFLYKFGNLKTFSY